jgi:hypothetical protein
MNNIPPQNNHEKKLFLRFIFVFFGGGILLGLVQYIFISRAWLINENIKSSVF